jgi:hypothetical protein
MFIYFIVYHELLLYLRTIYSACELLLSIYFKFPISKIYYCNSNRQINRILLKLQWYYKTPTPSRCMKQTHQHKTLIDCFVQFNVLPDEGPIRPETYRSWRVVILL